MAEIKCPMCGKPNPDDLIHCQFCNARLKPLISPSPDDREPIHPGDTPVKKDTSEFEGTGYRERLAQQGTISPGETPTKKDTKELEKALPAWLRQARNPDAPLDIDSGESVPDDGPASASEDETSPESGLPEWLSDLAADKGDTGDLLAGLASANKDDEEVPNWLADLRGDEAAGASLGADEDQASMTDAGGDDWLSRLGGDADTDKPSSDEEQPFAFESEGETDRLSNLGRGESEDNTAFPPEDIPSWKGESKAEAQEPEEESLDWLSDLQTEPAQEEPEPLATSDEGSLDWLSNLQAEPTNEQAESQTGAAGDLPSWLDNLSGESSTDEPLAEAEFSASDDGADWLSNLQAEPADEPVEPQSEGTEDLPSWLGALASETAEERTPVEADLPTYDDAPDWLSNLQAEPAEEPAEPQSSEPQPEEAEDLPNWLGALADETMEESTPVEAETPATGETEDWLSSFQAEATSEQVESLPESEDELPSWLGGLTPEPEKEKPPSAKAFQTGSLTGVEDEGVPGWLSNLQAEEMPVEAEQAEIKEEVQDESLAWMSGLVSESDSAEAPSQSPFIDGDVDESSEALPPWLEDVSSQQREEDSQPVGAADVFAVDMPEWLSEMKPTEDEGLAETALEAAALEDVDDDLRPADLPNWVQAMRPVEDALPDSVKTLAAEQGEVEEGGPLAGIAGVLPAGVLPTGRPRPYASRIQVTDTQQLNVGILEAVLNAESQPRTVKRSPAILSLRILRWLVALALILTVGAVAGLGSTSTPTFSLFPQELLDVRNWVDSGTSSSTPVLLVFDYDAALSGELEATAAPVLDHLAIHGVSLATVSTSPTGPALADRQMRILQSSHSYLVDQNFVNLGYLPGGPAGILGFAQQPARTGRATFWNTPVLASARKLDDFAAIFIITDSVETGQQWIEQTTNYRGASRLFLIISAQAEPMLRPYYESKQVQGIVTGLAGGASYEANLNRPGLARRYWDAYSMGLLISVIMIVFGAGWSLISSWISRRNSTEAK